MSWLRRGVSMIVTTVLLASPALAGTVAVSRQSSLGATSQDNFDLQDRSDVFGLYDNTLDQSLPGAGGGTTRAAASQRSDVDPLTNSGFVAGSMSAQVAEQDAKEAQAGNSFSFVFDVIDSPETLTLQGHVQSSFDAFARVTVQQPATEPVFQEVLDVGVEDRVDFDETLLLTPGRYSLVIEGFANGTPSGSSADFDASFSLSNPVPLPPAVWTGAVGLLVAMVCARRRASADGCDSLPHLRT